jgi:hypothetical protein
LGGNPTKHTTLPSLQQVKLTLKPDEVQICQLIGGLRSLIARSSGVKDAKIGTQDGAEADVMGFMAEYGFAKLMNTFPDLGLTPRSGSPDGVTPSGNRYDIKASKHPNARLLSSLKVNPDIDVYVLCVVDGVNLDYKGWAWKRDLIKQGNIINLGHGEGYALNQDSLTKFNEK